MLNTPVQSVPAALPPVSCVPVSENGVAMQSVPPPKGRFSRSASDTISVLNWLLIRSSARIVKGVGSLMLAAPETVSAGTQPCEFVFASQ